MTEANPRIAAVVLAAGASERMGTANKLHLPIDGEPLLRRVLRGLLDSRIDHIVVVLGHDHETTGALVEDLPLATVVNAAHEQGQMTSVHRGLETLDESFDPVLIALGDQPALQGADIDRLIEVFLNRDGGEVVIPTHRGERGNPVVISAAFRRFVLDDERQRGCRQLIDANPAMVRRVEMSSPAFVVDLDTPDQYADFIAAARPDGNEHINTEVG